jgi:hypothetical protein
MLKADNWFWCSQCECISYSYECDCHGTYCNGGGCSTCNNLYNLVKIALKNKQHPPEKELKQKLLDKYGQITSPEQMMLEEIFGKQDEYK